MGALTNLTETAHRGLPGHSSLASLSFVQLPNMVSMNGPVFLSINILESSEAKEATFSGIGGEGEPILLSHIKAFIYLQNVYPAFTSLKWHSRWL